MIRHKCIFYVLQQVSRTIFTINPLRLSVDGNVQWGSSGR